MNVLNKELFEYYKEQTKFWDDLKIAKEELSSPLLLAIPDSYKPSSSSLKIMLVGCETNGWQGQLDDVSKLMEEHQICCKQMLGSYEDFKNSPTVNSYLWRLPYYKRRAFWQWGREIKNKLDNADKSKTTLIIWNNLLKVGKKKGRGAINQNSLDLLKPHFKEFFLKEVEVLQPDVLIFVCGHKRVYLEQIESLGITLSPLKPDKYINKRILKGGSLFTAHSKKEILVLHSCHPSIRTTGKGSKTKLRNEVTDSFVEQIINFKNVIVPIDELRTSVQ